MGVSLSYSVGGGGAVSSVSNSDGTLTFSPTTGNVVASINLANPNTWTAIQKLPKLYSDSGYIQSDGSGNITLSNAGSFIENSPGALQFQPNMDVNHPLFFGAHTFIPYGPYTLFFGTTGNNNCVTIASGTQSNGGAIAFKPAMWSTHYSNDTAEIQGSDSSLHVVAPIAINPEGGEVGIGTPAVSGNTVSLGAPVSTSSGNILDDGGGLTCWYQDGSAPINGASDANVVGYWHIQDTYGTDYWIPLYQ